MAVTDYTVLRLTGVLNIKHLSFLELHVGVNAHGWAIVEGEAGENALAQLSEATAGREQQILTLDETGNEKCLFAGVISEAELMDAGGYRCFHIELLSGTCQMDQAIRSRSFQNVSQTYSQIAKQVIAEYPGGAAIISVGEDLIIERPIIQYRETDWAFLMRLASHCGGVVVPETHRSLPRLWFGFPDRSFTCQFPEDSYTSGISQRYYELGGSAAGFKKEDFFYYDVQSTQLCDLGWYTIFKGQPFLISEKYAKLEYGELIFTYRLGRPGLGWGKKFYNEKISGMTLLGEVVETARETLKLKLDIDRCWNPGGPYPYTWRPETGNFMYCMPKVGTRVSLYFPSYDEKAAIAVNCIRTNGGSCERMRDPSRRSFVTEHGKEMNLYPDEMSLIAGSEGKIRLSDKDGIEIGSQKPVIIFGREVVRFEAPKVAFLAPLGEIGMAKKSDFATDAVDSGFIVSNQYDFLAKSYTHMEGWDCQDFDPYNDAPPEGNFFLAIAGNVLAGLAAVALVTAALAITIGTGGIAGAIVAGACVTGVVAVGAQAYSDVKSGRTGSMKDYFGLGWQAAQIGAVIGAISGLISCAVFSIGTTIAIANGATALGFGGTMVCAGFSGGLTSIATQLLFNQGEIDWSKVGWSSLICTITAGTCYALRNFRFQIEIDNGDMKGVVFDQNTRCGNAFYRMSNGSAANVPFKAEFTGMGYRYIPGSGYQYIPGQGFSPYNWTWSGTSLVPTTPGAGPFILPGGSVAALPKHSFSAFSGSNTLALTNNGNTQSLYPLIPNIQKGFDDIRYDNYWKQVALLSQSTCSNETLYQYLYQEGPHYATTFAQTGQWPSNIPIPKNSTVLDSSWRFDWDQAPKGGFVLDSKGEPIKSEYIPKIGDVLDRYGDPNGTYLAPVNDGHPYSYDERSLPYVEDASKYHQYVVKGDFSDIKSYIDACDDPALLTEITMVVEKYYSGDYNSLKTYIGDIAPAFGTTNGGTQVKLPLSVNLLERLGLIEELK